MSKIACLLFLSILQFGLIANLLAEEVFNSDPSPGVWFLSGNYEPNYNDLLVIRLKKKSHDQLKVLGTATLNGSLQSVVLGGSMPKPGSLYTILDASSISGRYSYLKTNITSTLVFEPIYSANSVKLKVIRNYLNSELSPSLNPNEISVGGMLNRILPFASDDLYDVLDVIDQFKTNKLVARVYDQLGPRPSSMLATLAISEATLQPKNLIRRMQLLRRSSQQFRRDPPCQGCDDEVLPEGIYDTFSSCLPQEGKFGGFVTGMQLFGRHKQTDLQDAYSTSTTGLTVGADYEIVSNLYAGAMVGYNHSQAQLKRDAGEVGTNEAIVGLYGTGRIKKLWFDVMAVYSRNWYTTKRNIHFNEINRQAKAHPKGRVISAYFDVGRDICIGKWVFEPMASILSTHVLVDKCSEKGANSLNLDIRKQIVKSLQGTLGGVINREFEVCSWTVLSTIRGFYWYEFLDKSPRIRASFQGNSNYLFDTHSGVNDKEFATFGFGFATIIKDQIMAYFDYDAEVFRKFYFTQVISGGLRGSF